MTHESITNINMTEGFHTIFIYVNNVTGGLFIRMLLFSIQKRTTGKGDFPASVAIAGFVTAVTAILLKMVAGLVDPSSFWVSMIMAIIGTAWLFLAQDKWFCHFCNQDFMNGNNIHSHIIS